MEKSVKEYVHELITYDDSRASAPDEHCTTAVLARVCFCARCAPMAAAAQCCTRRWPACCWRVPRRAQTVCANGPTRRVPDSRR